MSGWINSVKLPKFYRYMFYRIYIYSVKFGNSSPEYSTLLMLSLTILIQSLCLITGLDALLKIGISNVLFNNGPIVTIVLSLLLLYTIQYLFYRKNKWKKYIKEFEKETDKQRYLGKYALIIYLFVSLIVLFRIMLWFVTFNKTSY
ncbi:hypothetical protein [uncultured Maribacter sp.]|uniref:hypothetical protein n=1 Tax=uncultured Maribacter sp. TaxID=431308 RepID=UPI0026057CAC|nr:hypothetical protein [uncultured Maribacter sp.]